jgi:hypothetical protein
MNALVSYSSVSDGPGSNLGRVRPILKGGKVAFHVKLRLHVATGCIRIRGKISEIPPQSKESYNIITYYC